MEGNGCVEKFIVSEQLEKKRTFPALTWSEDFSVQVNRLAFRYINTFFETRLVIPNVFIVFLNQFQTS